MTITRTVLFVFLALLCQPAWAYLDPGTGSMLLQVILGGFAAIGVALKLYWHRIRAFFGSGRNKEPEDSSAQSEP